LDRLQTDHVDLIQLHNLGHPEEWEIALGAGGALEAVVEARQQGLTRFIGVTGHGLYIPAMHIRSLKRFNFDSVLLPSNYIMHQNGHYIDDFEQLVALCEDRNVAVQTIKSITAGPWGSQERTHSVWYEPLVKQEDIDRAVHWVLGREGIFLNTAGDIGLLPKILDAASRLEKRPSDESMQQMVRERHMSSLFA
jgi:predicted aldo/keto reductase-like oxidoreductase